MTKQKKTRNDNKKYGEGGYDWVFLLHVTDWRIMKGIPPPPPTPFPHTHGKPSYQHMRNFILSSIPECICLQNEMFLKL